MDGWLVAELHGSKTGADDEIDMELMAMQGESPDTVDDTIYWHCSHYNLSPRSPCFRLLCIGAEHPQADELEFEAAFIVDTAC